MTSPFDELVRLAAKKISRAKSPVSFSGAGLSAESGIATFRDKNDTDALWRNFNPAELASQDGFKKNPEMIIDWYSMRRRTAAAAEPNAAHVALASQSHWIHITQNVDHLLESAGASTEQVLHLHGTLFEDHCNAICGYSEKLGVHVATGLRNCPECGAYMRPSVVWFGEALPQSVFDAAIHAAESADLFLVVGTSAQVVPAAGLIDVARQHGADIIVVNIEGVSALMGNDIELVGKAGDLLPQLFAGASCAK